MKKARTLPDYVIALIVVLLIVIVFSVIFFTQGNIYSKSMFTCESKEGTCMESSSCDGEITNFKCSNKDHICCIEIT